MNKKENNLLNDVYFGFIPAKYFVMFLVVTVVGLLFNATPKGFLGGFLICTVFGLLLEKIGDHLPIVKEYFGGGPFVTIFSAATIVYFKILPENSVEQITSFIKSMDFIGLVVGALICGSILTMDRKLLIKAGSLYVFPILGGLIVSFLLTSIVGTILGYGWKESIMFIALPIMGGGTSAGAVPTSQMYGATLSQDSSYYLSLIMPAVGIGNALAIVSAGLMNKLGNKFPSLTGNGILMKGFEVDTQNQNEEKINYSYLGTGFLITGVFFTIGIILNKFVPSIHYYAWTIISVAVVKIFGFFPEILEKQIEQWYKFLTKISIPAVLFGIGFVYTDLNIVFETLNATYFILVLTTIIGAGFGAGIVGKFIGFYAIESSLTAGLCMANMGGSGDLATLGAAKRMVLMPFSQISSRIGGAIVLIIASILAATIGNGL